LLNKSVIDEHIAEYRRTLRTDPHDETAHYGLGVAYFNLGLIEDSVRELTEAARLMPENPNIQTQLAVALRESARRGNADAQRQMHYRVDTALHLDPQNVEALLLRADVLIDTGNPSAAVESLQSAYALDESKAHDRLVKVLANLAHQQSRDSDWAALPKTWKLLGQVDSPVAMRQLTDFLVENRKLIPRKSLKDAKAVSAGSNVLVFIGYLAATLLIGAILAGLLIQAVGEESALSNVVTLAWLGMCVAVPTWAVRRKGDKSRSPGQYFDRDTLAAGRADLATSLAAATEVAQIKAEQHARRDALRQLDEQREAAKRKKSNSRQKRRR
jgi:tetratricopeptide (TPR) repeat protein